ncbi:hypothetical protein [uncultured Ruegeria sp.]|uniref:hypothetical protein n=1 Tax=uncultured Ruegeria sp. TaxID=259304 RepID=UPI00262BFAD3|nr:hypothetical protein [uncultured Ruegeria sp.]
MGGGINGANLARSVMGVLTPDIKVIARDNHGLIVARDTVDEVCAANAVHTALPLPPTKLDAEITPPCRSSSMAEPMTFSMTRWPINLLFWIKGLRKP